VLGVRERAPTLSFFVVFTLGLCICVSYAFVHTSSNSYEKWDIYNLAHDFHLYVFLWFQTYDGEPFFVQCHKLTIIPLHDPKDFSFSFFKSFPSSNVDCYGVLIFSSSYSNVLSFCSTNAP
jgi:hypothetical protein